jgi:hypothetical protein
VSPVLSPYLSLRMCVAPLEFGDICGRDAVTSRVMEGVVCPLCEEHAREFDLDPVEGALTGHES